MVDGLPGVFDNGVMSNLAFSLRSDTGAYRVGTWTLCAKTNRLTRAGEVVELERRSPQRLSPLTW